MLDQSTIIKYNHNFSTTDASKGDQVADGKKENNP